MMEEDYDNSSRVLKLDEEFKNCESCSLFELYAIFKDRLSKKMEHEMNPIIIKTKAYAEKFNKYGTPDTSEKASAKAMELRKILTSASVELTAFEKAQLLDLLPQKAEEAFTLIPSLRKKLPEEELQNILNLMQKMTL